VRVRDPTILSQVLAGIGGVVAILFAAYCSLMSKRIKALSEENRRLEQDIGQLEWENKQLLHWIIEDVDKYEGKEDE
jgi:hypothetical protein